MCSLAVIFCVEGHRVEVAEGAVAYPFPFYVTEERQKMVLLCDRKMY